VATALQNLGNVRKRDLPHENPTTPEQIEANRRAWLDQHPALLASQVVIVAAVAIAFAVAGAMGSIDTITRSANAHGLSGWVAWTPWAGAEGLLLLLVVWRVFCGLRRRASGLVVRVGSWGAASGALVLNAAPSYQARDWVGVVYHLAVPLATVVSVEILERLVAAVVSLILGIDQLAEAEAAAARTIRADRWVRRSHRWAAVKGGRVLSIAPRAVARTHVERVIKTEPQLLAGATARIAAFAALDCGTAAVLPAPAVADSLAQNGATAPNLDAPAESTVTLERADQAPPDVTLEDHAATALALVAPGHAELLAAPAAAPEQPVDLVKPAAPAAQSDSVFPAGNTEPAPPAPPVVEEVFDQEADQSGAQEQAAQDDQPDHTDQTGGQGQDDQPAPAGDQPQQAEQVAVPTVEEQRQKFVRYHANGELDLALYLSGPGDQALGGPPPARIEIPARPFAQVPAQAARMPRQVVTVPVDDASGGGTGDPDDQDEEPEDVEHLSPQPGPVRAGTVGQASYDALRAGRDAANEQRAREAKADRRELARGWWALVQTGQAGSRVAYAVGAGSSEKRLRTALNEYPLQSFRPEELAPAEPARKGKARAVAARAGRA